MTWPSIADLGQVGYDSRVLSAARTEGTILNEPEFVITLSHVGLGGPSLDETLLMR